MSLRFGYGTNGFTDHRLADALAVLADLGYDGVALTLDHAPPRPVRDDVDAGPGGGPALGDRSGLACVVETGARYLLDPLPQAPPDAARRRGRDRRSTSCGGAARSRRPGRRGGVLLVAASGRRPRPGHRLGAAGRRAVATRARRSPRPPAWRSPSSPSPGCSWPTCADGVRLRADARRARDGFGLTLDLGHCRVRRGPERARLTSSAAPAPPGQRADRRHAPRRARAPPVRRRGDRPARRARARSPTPATAGSSPSSCPATAHAAPGSRAQQSLRGPAAAAPRR